MFVLIPVVTIMTYGNVKAYKEPDFKIDIFRDNLIQVYEVKLCKDEPTMKEWILTEVKSNGLNPKYVERLINCENRGWDQKLESWTGDRGIFQINRKWHPEVSDKCAFDYKCNTKEAIRIIKEWNGYGAWVCSRLID